MLERARHRRQIEELLSSFPVVAIVGARQVGKTTLARRIAADWPGPTTVFDLEDPRDAARLQEPILSLEPLAGLVVLDEVHRAPGLFQVLRVLADRPALPARFLVLGSASADLLGQASESLAGRIAYHELGGFSLDEVGVERWETLWHRGGFPRSFVAGSDEESGQWRREFVRTFLERDLPSLGVRVPGATMRRFWTMLAHWHGQIWNASEFARNFGVADTTVRRHLDLLSSTFVVRQLPAWWENLAKRQVKAPKVYVSDSGLLHSLLGIDRPADLEGHPKVGGSWEGFALECVVAHLGARPEEVHFWASHGGAELDLLVVRGTRRLGFEFKRTAEPRRTRSMGEARSSLGLDSLTVVHAGRDSFPLGEGARAVALSRLLEDVPRLDS